MSNCFVIELAGISIGIRPLFSQTKVFCEKYITERVPEFWIEVCVEDIQFERRLAADPKIEDVYLESLAVYRKIAESMPSYGVLLVHGSALALDGNGYLFVANSGVGKSTHAALWRQVYGDRVTMINDDKPLLKVDGEGVRVYGSPWMGKHRLGSRTSAPLSGISFLHRAEENSFCRIDERKGFELLLSHCYRPRYCVQLAKTLKLIESVAGSVPLGDLYCNMNPSAAQTALDGMKGMQ